MKNVTTLLLLFIVLISLAPCSDKLECNDVLAVTTYQIIHSDETPLESCTSICICTCCGQRTIAVQQVYFEPAILALAIDNTMRPSSLFVEQLAQNIWQPPKIV